MSAKWTFWAWEQPIKKAPLKLALLQLANNANDDGISWYSVPKMAKSCGMSDRSLQGHLKTLEDMGLLEIKDRPGTSRVYTLMEKEIEIILHTPEESAGVKVATPEGSADLPPKNLRGTPEESADDPNNEPNNRSKDLIVEENPQRDKFEEEDLRLAEWMYQKIKITVPSAKAPNFKTWADKIRLMRERDNRTIREIAELFDWANKDSFWCVNILSPQKLRDKWTQLDAKRIKQNETSGNGSGSSSAQQAINNLRADLEGQPRESDQTNQAFMDSNDRDLRNQMDQGVRGGTDITLGSGDWEVRT